MGTRTTLRLNHEPRALNSRVRLHGAATTSLGGASSTSHFIFPATPMPEVLHRTGIRTAVRWQMQRAARTDAAHCGGRCSALRFLTQSALPFAPHHFTSPRTALPLSYETSNKLCTRPIRTSLIPHSETSGRTARRSIEHNARPTPVRSEISMYIFLIITKRNPQKHREQLVFPANCLTLQERRGKTSPRVHGKQPDRTPQPA